MTYKLINYLLILSLSTFFLQSCFLDDDPVAAPATAVAGQITIPDISVSCLAASATRCDATPDTNKVIIIWFIENTSTGVAYALGTLSCNGTTCTASIDSYTSDGSTNITELTAGNYQVVAYLDVTGDVSAVEDITNIGSDDATCLDNLAEGGIVTLNSALTSLTLDVCLNTP